MEDNVLGAFIVVFSVFAALTYGLFLFFSEFGFLLIKWTAFLAVAGILCITAWIGYTLYSTPSFNTGLDVEEE